MSPLSDENHTRSRASDGTVANSPWPSIAVVGAGAVGCYFGGMLARAGAPVTLIAREQHAEAINHDGLFIDSAQFKAQLPVTASSSLDVVAGADLVLVCV